MGRSKRNKKNSKLEHREIRRVWKINPKSRIKESKKVYKRPAEKAKVRREKDAGRDIV